MKISGGVILYFFIGLLVCHTRVHSNSYNIFGADSRSTAMGNAYTTLATDPTGLYYNPAGIVYSSANTILEFSYSYPFMDLNFKGKSLAAQLYLDRAENVDRAYGFSIGGITKVATLLGNDLSFGVLVYITRARNLISEKFKPDNEPISFLFEEQTLTDIILAGIAYRVHKYISIGAGVSINSDANVSAETDVLAEPFYIRSEGKLPLNFSPHLGFLFTEKRYRLGISFRGEKSDHIVTVLKDKLSGEVKEEATIVNSPAQTTLGASFLPVENILLSLDVSFVDWSNYTPPWANVTGEKISPLIAGEAKLKDTILPKFGIEYTLFNNRLALRGGYIFRQSPVPDQTGTSNLIDSDTHIFSCGAGYGFTVSGIQKAIEIDLHFQYHLMTERETVKYDEANPVYPGYTASGNVYNAGITIKFNFSAPQKKSEHDENIEIES
jgi:long-chain fatty acid transport protein